MKTYHFCAFATVPGRYCSGFVTADLELASEEDQDLLLTKIGEQFAPPISRHEFALISLAVVA